MWKTKMDLHSVPVIQGEMENKRRDGATGIISLFFLYEYVL